MAVLLGFGFLGVQVVMGHGAGDWCATHHVPRGVDGVRTEWTWGPPPGWDCVYTKNDKRQRSHDVSRRRAYSK